MSLVPQHRISHLRWEDESLKTSKSIPAQVLHMPFFICSMKRLPESSVDFKKYF